MTLVELAHTFVTDWVKWQQHQMMEVPPKPITHSISPEKLPDQKSFRENCGYETYSEGISPSTGGQGLNDQRTEDQGVTPNRNSALRRSRQERERDNRSSMEVLSQINKMSEIASQNDLTPPKPPKAKTVPPHTTAVKSPGKKDGARKQENGPIDYVYLPEHDKMLDNMIVKAKSDESDTLQAIDSKSPGSRSRRSKGTRHSNSNVASPNNKKKDHFGELP